MLFRFRASLMMPIGFSNRRAITTPKHIEFQLAWSLYQVEFIADYVE